MSIYKSDKKLGDYQESKINLLNSVVEHQLASDRASTSTARLAYEIDGDTAFLVNLSDIHIPEGNIYALADLLKKLARIPNCRIILGGDQINNSITRSVGNTHEEVTPPNRQIEMLAELLKQIDRETPLLDKIVAIVAGNHENRTDTDTSINPTELLVSKLGNDRNGKSLEEKYVKNITELELILNKRNAKLKKDGTVNTISAILEVMHGENAPSKPTVQAQQSLDSQLNFAVDGSTKGHNHKPIVATEIKQIYDPIKGVPVKTSHTYFNFGSLVSVSEYAERAGYPMPRLYDGEVMKITNVGNQIVMDMVNVRSIINQQMEDSLVKVESKFKELEERKFYTEAELTKAYNQSVYDIYSEVTQNFKDKKAIKEEFLKQSGTPDSIYLASLSGFHIGDENPKFTVQDIKSKIKALEKLPCSIVLNGDIIHYKKAFTLTNKNGNLLGEKFPEETFSYMLQAAKILKPVKDKIVAYNLGHEELKVMQNQSNALAKMAMSILQMPEELCYEPYNQAQVEAQQLKIQANQVKSYNKVILAKEVEKAYKDIDKAILDCMPYINKEYLTIKDSAQKEKLFQKVMKKYNSLPDGMEVKANGKEKYVEEKNFKLDYLKKILSLRLREENSVLDFTKHSSLINQKFPLEDIELRSPNVKLIQNIMCHMLGINPEKIAMSTEPNTSSYFTLKVKDDKGKTRTIGFSGSSAKSNSGRSATENYLKGKTVVQAGANVYYTNTKKGKEFVMLDVKKHGNKVIDTVYISAGSFSVGSEGELTANKVYRFFTTSPNNEKVTSRGIYHNLEKDFNLYCESLNYETLFLEEDVLSKVIQQQIKASYQKSFDNLKELERESKLDGFNYGMSKIIEQKEKQAQKKPRKKTTTNKAKDCSVEIA